MNVKEFKKEFDDIVEHVETVIKGKTEVVRLALVAICAEGHVLFEDVPGTGKSMLARALSQSMSATANRIQCTPDMLPGDITGSSIYDPDTKKFTFRAGPVFCNILLADEVNRATPKTQSSLLEAMAERKVSIDGKTYELPKPFLVLATQNPVELAGTFPLPEAQLDRFLFKLSMGYPGHASEFNVMYANSRGLTIEKLGAVVDTTKIVEMIDFASTINVAEPVGHYIVDIVEATRNEPSLQLGASPRASINLMRAGRVLAASDGRTMVFPDDIRYVLKPVMAHRLILTPDAILRGETVDNVLDRVIGKVKAPMLTESSAMESPKFDPGPASTNGTAPESKTTSKKASKAAR